MVVMQSNYLRHVIWAPRAQMPYLHMTTLTITIGISQQLLTLVFFN